MALMKLDFTDLLKAVILGVQTSTGKRCYDAVPKDAPSPFYFAEIIKVKPDNNKSGYVDMFTVYIHCIASPNTSSIGVHTLIKGLEEALSTNIVLPEPYGVLLQTSLGLIRLKSDETGEKHAILGYDFSIIYGFIKK